MKNKVLKARVTYSDNILNENIKGYCLELFDDKSKEWNLSLACEVDDKNMMSADFVEEIRKCIVLGYEFSC
jgi:hypothetical protein